MINAATECQICSNYVNLQKSSIYKNKLTLLADTKDTLDIDLGFGVTGEWQREWQNSPISGKLAELSLKILADWRAHHANVPGRLYHYTTGSGLVGMLSNGEMWASDLAYLNDASELQYAIDLIKDVKNSLSKDISPEAAELFRRSEIFDAPHIPGVSYHVACFCTNGDLLSQWRAYGGATDGYAIGFATERFIQSNLRLRRVLYDPEIQRKLVSDTIRGVVSKYENIRCTQPLENMDIALFSQFLNIHLQDYIYSFKHPSFHEENEWRIVLDLNRHEHLPILKFRESQGRLIPYVPFRLNVDKNKNPTLPVISITMGPTTTPQLAKKSLHLMIERYGFDHVEVLGTDSPLRV
jgi:hypothetical protein